MFKNKIAKAASLFIALSMLLASCTFETPAVPEKKSIVVLDTDVGLGDAAAMIRLSSRPDRALLVAGSFISHNLLSPDVCAAASGCGTGWISPCSR